MLIKRTEFKVDIIKAWVFDVILIIISKVILVNVISTSAT